MEMLARVPTQDLLCMRLKTNCMLVFHGRSNANLNMVACARSWVDLEDL